MSEILGNSHKPAGKTMSGNVTMSQSLPKNMAYTEFLKIADVHSFVIAKSILKNESIAAQSICILKDGD